ncbi:MULTISPECIES: TetR/AcrR family transcriptional regulator [Acinetobacter]|jgi:AcrR family transcriptional regulator|uniref:Fatty acid metabolism regulator protein n=1 Tax=Acinetobacter johnsonii TaxID=40214 RepID=A0A1R7QC03_ACIJO|nr:MULTISPECIES: TetR/AcrR family transcriptional regulator [Acinetobacter]MBL4859353.1 TetR/AcrR family transcriptional regulator [Acinetobacter sp.]NWK61681.1 TetR/AcrR family transcriptional regulator [Acinetobacter sp. SwsAc3]ALV72401.1 TetR family transcriptional regulator [Acinetobacter johnsonii XBB1]MBO7705314.1 TetR/AcrR family transcriptional regulator [Acinetobacter sp.]MDG9786046.1 TetR/AcrR family transcriptional regulator [Acinetobacter johnsonii]
MSYKRSSLMQERMEQNREAILQSARELIAQGGIKDAQIQAIAERAGVSSGLVYRYFDNKSQVLIEVLSEAIQHEVKILNHIAESELTSKQKLDKAVTTFVKRAMNSPQLAYSLMFEPVDAELEHERFRSKQLIKQSIKEILAAGKINGEFGFEDLNTAALCVVGAMTFVVIEPLNPSRNVMFDQNYKDYFVKQIAEFCVNAVQVQEEK